MDIWSVAAALVSAVTAMMLFYLQRAQKRRDERYRLHQQANADGTLLAMELQFATAELACAVAMAVKRGSANGEVDKSVEEYYRAREKYIHFIGLQAAQHKVMGQ